MATIATMLQNAVVASLQGYAELAGVQILARLPKQTFSDVNSAMRQTTLCIFVFPAMPGKLSANLPGYYGRIVVRIQVSEDPALNAGVLNAYDLSEIVQRWASVTGPVQITDASGYTFNPLVATEDSPRPVADLERIMYELVFTTDGGTAAAAA